MKFRPLFVATQSPGDVYYRCNGFAREMGGEVFPAQCLTKNVFPNWEEVMVKDPEIMYQIEKAFARCNLAVFQRVSTGQGLSMIMALKEKYDRKILAEIDDNALMVDECNPGSAFLKPNSDMEHWFKAQLKTCDGVIVSTDNLKEVYMQFNKNIHVVKNSLDFEMWDKLRKPKKDNKIRIGWQGGQMHNEDLDILRPVLPKLLKKHKNIEFHFFGFIPPFLEMDKVFDHKIVPFFDYPKKVMGLNLDITLAPLVETPFNRGKSSLRVLEAGASRSAVVATANPHLPYASVIDNGEDGYLAKTTEDWVNCLDSLILSPVLRRKFSDNLYAKVKRDFNIKDEAKRYEHILRKI